MRQAGRLQNGIQIRNAQGYKMGVLRLEWVSSRQSRTKPSKGNSRRPSVPRGCSWRGTRGADINRTAIRRHWIIEEKYLWVESVLLSYLLWQYTHSLCIFSPCCLRSSRRFAFIVLYETRFVLRWSWVASTVPDDGEIGPKWLLLLPLSVSSYLSSELHLISHASDCTLSPGLAYIALYFISPGLAYIALWWE